MESRCECVILSDFEMYVRVTYFRDENDLRWCEWILRWYLNAECEVMILVGRVGWTEDVRMPEMQVRLILKMRGDKRVMMG